MRRRVDRILTRFSTDIDHASRVTFAQSNEVWLAKHVVARVSQQERSTLFREITLAPAITGLRSRLRTLHTADPAAAHAAGYTWTPFYALDSKHARSQLTSLIDRGALNPATGRHLDSMLASMFEAIHLAPIALTHTDAAPGDTA